VLIDSLKKLTLFPTLATFPTIVCFILVVSRTAGVTTHFWKAAEFKQIQESRNRFLTNPDYVSNSCARALACGLPRIPRNFLSKLKN